MRTGEVACVVAVPPHLGPLLVARAVQGAGVAVQAAGLELTLGDISTPPTRARTLGLRQVCLCRCRLVPFRKNRIFKKYRNQTA